MRNRPKWPGCEKDNPVEVKGGYFIRLHAKELPWIQLELSREGFLTLHNLLK